MGYSQWDTTERLNSAAGCVQAAPPPSSPWARLLSKPYSEFCHHWLSRLKFPRVLISMPVFIYHQTCMWYSQSARPIPGPGDSTVNNAEATPYPPGG